MKKAALIVGINNYRRAPLRGCVHDARALLDLLTERHGVPPAQTYTLIDRQATRTAILQGLQWLAAQGADVAYFCYSGHGTRVPDVDGDEGRREAGARYDQALVPVDYERNGLILDDDLAAAYWTFPPDTKLIVHLDSCFSAKAERGILGTGRGLYDRHIRRRVDRALPSWALPRPIVLESQARRETRRGVIPERRQVLLSGCRDFETSADAYLGGQYRGAMTHAVLSALADLGEQATYLQIVEEARRRLLADGFPQVPQLSGPSVWLHQPLFT